MALNLERQLLFYGAYHHDPTNVAIHTVCVPIILFTGIMLGCNTGPHFTLPDALTFEYLRANPGTITAFIYSAFYLLLEPVAGASFVPFIFASAIGGTYLIDNYGRGVNYFTGVIHLISWIAQFVGHGHYEGRAPALLDNLVQALLLAPLFVWIKILFSFGYRPELKERIDKGVEVEIKRYRKEQDEKRKLKAKAKAK